MSARAGHGANIQGSVKKNPNPQRLKQVLQGEEVEMPKLGGALITSVEKPFPEWEAGRMDPVGWRKTGVLPFLLPPAFPFLLGHIYYFTWVITSLSAHGGVGGGRK